ncbi:MAG TPA: hypothetical protein VLW65_16250 [Bryobacteraceae bacterium]|jgi:hypothetical protein|nr:hypothetical protein [Bryobacteraceae bacterium]
MEAVELPVLEDVEESSHVEDHIDLAAFQLWREASRLENTPEEDQPAVER